MAPLPGLPQGTQPAQPAPVQSGETIGETQPNVTPEEQAEYDMVMENTAALLYTDKGVQPAVLEQLQVQQGGEGNGHILALAQGAVTIISQLDDSAREAGKPISDEILYHAGLGVIEELAEIADAGSIYDYTEEDMTGAFAQALDMYREKAIADGRTTKETLEGQFAEINEAEAAGQLDAVLPGLSGAAPAQPQQMG